MLALIGPPRDGFDTVVATVGDTTIRSKMVYVDGSQARIAIDAPRDAKVVRGELLGDTDR